MYQEIKIREIAEAIAKNDPKRVKALFESAGENDEVNPPNSHELYQAALSFASNMARRKKLQDSTAYEILGHIATEIDLLRFLRLLNVGNEMNKYDIIPYRLRKAILDNEYTHDVSYDVIHLNVEEFEALVGFIATMLRPLFHFFNEPIIYYIYDNRFIDTDLLFAYLALCVKDQEREASRLSFMESIISGPL